MSAVTVIVVNFNTGPLARRAVESAAADLTHVDWDAIVVDNASTSDGVEALDGLPRTRIIANTRNLGFGAAVNEAARETNAPLLWLLNPDCEVTPGAFRALRETLDAHADCAIAAPRLLNADGSVQASARGEPTAWTGLFGRHSLLTRFFPASPVARRNLPAEDLVNAGVDSAPVDWVMGAAMLVRRAAFDRVGGFDERLAVDFNDVDYCLRLREAGYRIVFTPFATLYHHESASFGPRTQNEKEIALMRSRWGAVMDNDPYYHPELTRDFPDYRIRA
jgi:hypothetical protein